MTEDVQAEEMMAQNSNAPVQFFYVQRTMKMYGINEYEAQGLSSLNAQASAFFSLGSCFSSFALGIWTNAAFATSLTPAGEVAQFIGAPAMCVIALAFFLLAWQAVKSRKNIWATIKGESREVPALSVLPRGRTHFS